MLLLLLLRLRLLCESQRQLSTPAVLLPRSSCSARRGRELFDGARRRAPAPQRRHLHEVLQQLGRRAERLLQSRIHITPQRRALPTCARPP
eukprot:1750015-Rhodomonas_salina.1